MGVEGTSSAIAILRLGAVGWKRIARRYQLQAGLLLMAASSATGATAQSSASSDDASASPPAAAEETSAAEPAPNVDDAAASPPARIDPAERTVRRAEALFDAGNYDAALPEFVAAYSLLAKDPRRFGLLNNIAVCHERMFRYDLALAYYERYLREGQPAEADRKALRAVIDTLRGLLATLQLRSNVVATVWVDDRAVGESPGTIMLPAGRHVIELRAKLHEPARRELLTPARTHQTLAFDLPELSQYRGLSPAFFWLGTGLSVAALSSAVALGVTAKNADADAKDRAARSPWFVSAADKREIHSLQLAADISFATAAAFGLSTLLLATQTHFTSSEERNVSWSLDASQGAVAVAAEGRLP